MVAADLHGPDFLQLAHNSDGDKAALLIAERLFLVRSNVRVAVMISHDMANTVCPACIIIHSFIRGHSFH